MSLRVSVFIIAAVVGSAGCGSLHVGSAKKQEATDAALQQALRTTSRPAFVTSDAEGKRLWQLTRDFYEKRGYRAAWIERAAPTGRLHELVAALRDAHHEGVDPELYSVGVLEQRLAEASKGFLTKKGFDPKEAGAMDAWLTYLYLKYSSDLADGMSDLVHADPTWKIKPERYDALAHLEKAVDENRIAASLTELTPNHPQYAALKKAFAAYREQQKNGGWPRLPANVNVKPGQQTPHAHLLARRLAASGDFNGSIPDEGAPAVYGPDLQEAVKRFQRRHGLADDGAITPAVVTELNVSIETRIRDIALNLERWRWLPRDLGERFILVNIPEYRLEVWENGRVPLSMRTVVGKQDTPTPIFNDEMTHIVFSPYWNVPPDIAQGETLPEVMKDPGFLERQNMEVLDVSGTPVDPASIDLSNPAAYRFRQRPGSDNALGFVKFMFPNQYHVYLHDTPSDSLFGRASRSFSHGCVRVEQPEALAQYVLADKPEWTPEAIRGAMHAGEEKHVKLGRPIPVYLGYWTARVSADGLLQFRKDVYEVNARQIAKLAERMERLRRSAAAAAASMVPKNTAGARPATQ